MTTTHMLLVGAAVLCMVNTITSTARACHDYDLLTCSDNSGCYTEYETCDGRNDCRDGTDENIDMCRNYTCRENHMKCADGIQCLPSISKCNGIPGECNDHSDEANCEVYTCPAGRTKCRDGKQCVWEGYMCTNSLNSSWCNDESHKDSDYCAAYTCPAGYTKCRDGKQCLKKHDMCTYEWFASDCSDGSNKDNDYCAAYTCQAGYTKCRDGKQCIKEQLMCNNNRYHTVCKDGSDQDITYCAGRTQ